jgi:hypothetical protein
MRRALLALLLAAASPALAADLDDVRTVLREPAQRLVTDCEGGPCLMWGYRNQSNASLVLMLVFGPDGELRSATQVLLGPDGEPAAAKEDTEGFKDYLRNRLKEKESGT